MAASAPLKSLTLTAFRGSAATFTLNFEKNKKLTLIYGENGTGKTTICDAFEFLAFERIGSLENRGMGKGLEKFWPTAGKPATALAVDLETHTDRCSGRIVDKKVSVSPVSARPRIELLRQRQILELIQAQPAARYDAIKRFIDIETFERSEESLRQLSKTLATEKQQAQAAEQENLDALQGFYEAAGSPTGLNAVTWAKQKLAEPTTGLDGEIVAIEKLRASFQALKGYPEKLKSRNDAIVVAQAAADAADQGQLAALNAAGDGAGDKLSVLSAGNAYIESHPTADECPLCASSENIDGLGASIKAQLAQLSALKSATEEWRKQHGLLTAANAALKQADDEYQNAIAKFTTTQTSHKWKPVVQIPAAQPPTDSAVLPSWLTANEAIATAWAGIEAGWRDESKFLAQLDAASKRYDSNADRVKDLTSLIPKIQEALGHCVDERQKFTDSIITEIAQEVGKLYEKVHPGEGLDTIALELDPKKRASIELKADFSGQDAPPQAYFSQSHLDTLGLCVFLALAARDRANETILILDDVLGSIDEPHVERVVGMIYDASRDFRHTIVTTHYRPWRERFRWGALKPDQPCQFVELTQWNIGDGMGHVGCLPEIDLLKGLLAQTPPDTQSICSKAGVILEYALDYLTLRYECRVPRRHGNPYSLGDLLLAIDNKLRDALRVEIRDGLADSSAIATNVIQLKPILDELARIGQVRNALGAHFKMISFDLLAQDAIGFANHVVQLVEALSHPDHGWPGNDKSGSYWRNSADSRRMHPLKKPS